MDQSRRRTTTRTTHTNFINPNDNSENIFIDAIDLRGFSEPSATMAKKPIRSKEKEKKVKRAPTRERWLLTRKTWKYMADAGRKLIPDGASNRPEDIPKIEEYFQSVCRNEPKFLHWKRKQSYPGALTSLRRKRHSKVWGSPPKASSADEAEDERDESHHLLVMIEMLEKYLNLKEGEDKEYYSDKDENIHSPLASFGNTNLKKSSLQPIAGTKSSETNSLTEINTSKTSDTTGKSREASNRQAIFEENTQPCGSNYSLARSNELLKQTWLAQSNKTSEANIDSSTEQIFLQSHRFSDTRTSIPSSYATKKTSRDSFVQKSTSGTHTSLLLEVLKNYIRTSKNPLLSHDRINSAVLKDKQLLRQIRDELKQQHLDRAQKLHTSRSAFNLFNESTRTIPPSASLTSSTNKIFNFWHHEPRDDVHSHVSFPSESHINDSLKNNRSTEPQVKRLSHERYFYSSGIQTDPIPITYVHQLYNDYKTKKIEKNLDKDKSEKGAKHSTRKSSIDNEDVSQSVSDTIKRYLRMARKKNSNDNDANRFKRVNYDKNLRNIKAKGEITLPGDDDGNMKGCQTNDDWVDHVMRHIKILERENVSPDNTGDIRMSKQQNEFDYTRQVLSAAALKSKSSSTSPSHSSPSSPSPTGLFHSSTQFLSNLLWHGHGNNEKPQQNLQQQMLSDYNNFPNTSTAQPQTIATVTMQKSKSSSNVGQVFSKKIWKSRSKSQTRTASPTEFDGSGSNIKNWMPQGNCIWASSDGKRVKLTNTKLVELTDVERKSLHRVAIQKLSEILKACKVPVSVPIDLSESSNKVSSKPQKRRAPLLIKRKALTTSFFDSSKSKDSNRSRPSGLVFGLTLEQCIDNDQTCNKPPTTDVSLGSRHSIISLGDQSIQNIQFGSCESLPAKGQQRDHKQFIDQAIDTSRNVTSDIQIDKEKVSFSSCTFPAVHPILQNVPAFFNACISFLLQHGMDVVGIFRVSGSMKRVLQLREDFDNGNIHEIHSDTSPHDVAALLKEFLRELPEPLLCRSLYQAFVGTQRVRNRRLQLEALSYLIQLLPVAHRDTLYVLLHFLSLVIKCSEDNTLNGNVITTGNKMDAMNLATIMAPNILPTETDPTLDELDERLDVINVIRTLIDHYEEMFSVKPEIMDDVYTTMMDSFPQQLDFLLERPDIFCRYEEDVGSSLADVQPSYEMVLLDGNEHRQISDVTDSNGSRRVYVREEFTHENAAKGDTNTNARRERISKMKYQEPENEISRRRRRDKPGSQTPSSISLTQHQLPTTAVFASITTKPGTQSVNSTLIGPSHSFISDTPNSPTRRLSSPFVTHDSGVLSASLQLPVHVQKQDLKSTLSLATDLADMHLTEDGSETGHMTKHGSVELISQRNRNQQKYDKQMIKGSLSFGGPAAVPTQQQNDVRLPIRTPDHVERVNESLIEKSMPAFATPLKEEDRKTSTESIVFPTPTSFEYLHTRYNEPQLTPSISNIGGAVLRSKTADFERLLLQNKKNKGSGNFSSVNESVIPVKSKVTTLDSSADSQMKKHPIYKRKELISSVQSSEK